LLGFLAGLGVGLLLVHDPGVGQVEQLGHRQQVVEAQAVGFLPAVVALLVAAGGIDAVPVALVAVVAPDGDLQDADADLVCGFRHDDLLLLEFPAPPRGLTARKTKQPQPGALATVKLAMGWGPLFLLDRPGGCFIRAGSKALCGLGVREGGELSYAATGCHRRSGTATDRPCKRTRAGRERRPGKPGAQDGGPHRAPERPCPVRGCRNVRALKRTGGRCRPGAGPAREKERATCGRLLPFGAPQPGPASRQRGVGWTA